MPGGLEHFPRWLLVNIENVLERNHLKEAPEPQSPCQIKRDRELTISEQFLAAKFYKLPRGNINNSSLNPYTIFTLLQRF
jgi:hypothetical protein